MASDQPIDYQSVLADLRAKRAALDAAIASMEAFVTGMPSNGSSAAVGTGRGDPQTIEGDTFFGLSIVDAAKKYLGMVKKPQSVRDIAQALEKGGLTHSSSDFTSTLSTVLSRRDKNVGDIVKVKREWGLVEWYPGFRRGRGTKGQEKQEEQGQEDPTTETAS